MLLSKHSCTSPSTSTPKGFTTSLMRFSRSQTSGSCRVQAGQKTTRVYTTLSSTRLVKYHCRDLKIYLDHQANLSDTVHPDSWLSQASGARREAAALVQNSLVNPAC